MFLAKARQRVIFTQNGNNRPFAASFGHDGRWHSRNVSLSLETMLFQHGHMLGSGSVLFETKLGRLPHPIRQAAKVFGQLVDTRPDFIAILHWGNFLRTLLETLFINSQNQI